MAIRPFNSIAGISVGDPAITVVQANADVTTVNLTANGISNLGSISNVLITGGSDGQFLTTDGNGNLSFSTVNIESNRAAPMPYYIATGESYIVNENFQGLFSQTIEIDGELVVDGSLIEVGLSTDSVDDQILYDNNGIPTGNTGFTFIAGTGNLNIPGNINVSGSIIPSANDTYDLGSSTRKWANAYFGGNTIFVGNSTISVNENGFVVITNDLGGSYTVEGAAATDTTKIENGNSNVQVYANSDVAFTITGTSNVFVVNIAGANLTGNLTTGGVKTDNLYYANGTAWNFGQDPGGTNTQIQFNDNGNFAGAANLTYNKTTNNLALNGNFVVSNGVITSSGNITAPYFLGNVQGNISGNIVVPGNNTSVIFNDSGNAGASDAFTFNKSTNTVTASNLSVSGNALISGNLTVDGNLIYVNVEELAIEDPIINLQTGPNGAAPTSNSGKDVGTALNYYDTQAQIAFMGWDNSNAEFAFGSNTSISSEVVTFNTLGNVRAQTFKGNVESTTANFTGNLSAGNISGANVIAANYLISNSGCVSINGGVIAFSSDTNTAGIFNTLASSINLGLNANITLGKTDGNVTARGNLVANNISTTGNVVANLITGTLTTSSQANITTVGTLGNLSVTGNVISNNTTSNNLTTNSLISKRTSIAVTTPLTVIDSFSASDYRSAKYVVSSQNDNGFESLEILLVHNDINSFVTVYGAINDGGGNTVTISTGINSGNVEVRATGTAGNTEIRLIGTYVPVI